MRYSEGYSEYDGPITQEVREALDSVARYFNIPELKPLFFDEYSIVVCAEIETSIPPGGVPDGVDIRENEPILIKISLLRYPNIAPSILSDRMDFPKDRLSHLYAVSKGKPASLCLVRGNIGEWFADKRLPNLLDLAKQWFFKAGAGQLTTDGGEFDPIRLDRYISEHIVRYELLEKAVRERDEYIAGCNFACLLSMVIDQDEDKGIKYKTNFILHAATSKLFIDPLLELQKKGKLGKAHLTTSVVVWDRNNRVDGSYETDFPDNYGSLKEYLGRNGIGIDHILKSLDYLGLIYRTRIPVIHAVKRPRKLIGFPGDIEFLFFTVPVTKGKNGIINPGDPVNMQSHIEPFSTELAGQVSGEKRSVSTLYLGAGSLGSKIIIHDARAGKCLMGICDNDKFLEHNQARHGLFSDNIGENKATAVASVVEQMLDFEAGKKIEAYPYRSDLLDNKQIEKYGWLVDSTASLTVQNWLVNRELPQNLTVSRCEIAHEGRLGLLYIEGKKRNPRVDDLVNLAYYRALKLPALERWRAHDQAGEDQELNIGLGCSSVTSIIADDTISTHAAMFSRVLQNESGRETIEDNGLLFINRIEHSSIPKAGTEYELVAPFDNFSCQAGSGWELRMMAGIRDGLKREYKKFNRRETGGVLVGICNYKTKTIHVYDYISAPPDSIHTPISFIRGVRGLREKIDKIKLKTGNMIGYVGEWHTHPMQLESLSGRDKETVEELKPLNRQVPIPTLSLIVTNTKCLPFVYL